MDQKKCSTTFAPPPPTKIVGLKRKKCLELPDLPRKLIRKTFGDPPSSLHYVIFGRKRGEFFVNKSAILTQSYTEKKINFYFIIYHFFKDTQYYNIIISAVQYYKLSRLLHPLHHSPV